MKMKVCEAVWDILFRGGVNRVYGIVGTSILPAINSLGFLRDKIRYISCRHEQVAGSMADAEGRITQKPGVAIVHAAPGALNASISVANAYKDASPMLLIAGSVSTEDRGRDGFLDVKLKETFEHFTIASYRIDKPEVLPNVLTEAYRRAISIPRGPVFIEIAENLWHKEIEIDENNLNFKADSLPRLKEEDGKDCKRMLDESFKPLILSGGGVIHAKAAQDLRKFAEAYNIPVITTGNGRGAIPEDHPLCYGRSGYAGGNSAADYAFANADLIFVIGATVSDLTDYSGTWKPGGRVVVVHPYQRAIEEAKSRGFIAVKADAKSFINFFVKVPPGELIPKKDGWIKELDAKKEEWNQMLRRAMDKPAGVISPGGVLRKLREILKRDAIVSTGAGMHLIYVNDFVECYEPGTFLATNNFGSMGFGLAGALAAKVIYPERETVAILGDGEFMMTLQDMETAVREKLNVKIVVLNDNSYRVLRVAQVLDGLEPFGTEHTNPDFIALAGVFGFKGFRITPDNIDEPLKEFISVDSPALLEIPLDIDDIPPTNMEAVLKMRNRY